MPKDPNQDGTKLPDASPPAHSLLSDAAAAAVDFEPPKVQLDLQSVDLEVSLVEVAPEGPPDLGPTSVAREGTFC